MAKALTDDEKKKRALVALGARPCWVLECDHFASKRAMWRDGSNATACDAHYPELMERYEHMIVMVQDL